MTGVQRFFGNDRNDINGATLTSTTTNPAAAVFRDSVTRTGNGNVRLTGSFTGDDDAEFDVEIQATAGSTKRVTESVLYGVGNGTMTGVSASAGATAQTITVKLVDAGSETLHAWTEIGGVEIQAQSAGAAGNNIFISVTEALTDTASSYSTVDVWSTSDEYKVGEEWDYGAYALNADGTIHSSTTRLKFGDDPQIYRQYKKYENGEWRYYLTPAVVRDIPADVTVYTVTGSRTVTIDNGAASYNHTSIVTLYDLLDSIRDNDTLVEVVDVIANDRTPGGQAAIDLPLKTDPYALPVINSGSTYVQGLNSVSVNAASAKTENVTVTCKNNDVIGSETWEVRGPLTGLVGTATTNVANTSGPVNFTIPQKLPTQATADGNISAVYSPSDRATAPVVCFDHLRLGAEASNKSVTFTYTARPTTTTSCDDVAVSGSVSSDCLGVEVEAEGGGSVAITDQGYWARVEEVSNWYQGFVDANTEINPVGVLKAATNDLELAAQIRTALLSCLSDLYNKGTLAWDAWVTLTAYEEDDVVEPTTRNGYKYRAQGDGTTGAGEPSWPTTIGNTVVDSGVTWECVAKIPEDAFDAVLSDLDTELTFLESLDESLYSNDWAGTTAYSLGDTVTPTTRNGYNYACSSAGTTAGGEPTWPTTLGGTVTDGTVTWTCVMEQPYVIDPKPVYSGVRSGTALFPGDICQFRSGSADNDDEQFPGELFLSLDYLANAATMGTYDTTEVLTNNQIFQVGGQRFLHLGQWDVLSATDIHNIVYGALHYSNNVTTFLTKYKAECDKVRAIAMITPGFNSASTISSGSSCWQDPGDAYYWEDRTGYYLPVFTNRVYHSARRVWDADAGAWTVTSTKEFAFAIKCADTSSLTAGDTVTVSLGDVSSLKTYQVGDKFTVPVIAAADLYLTGGQTGDLTHTWSVTGSTDGALTDYAVVDGSEAAYASHNLAFTIYRGGINYQLGDYWRFEVAANQFKWRKDGGAWSAAIDIPASGSTALSDGLSAVFDEGATPSFESTDIWSFTARQPNSPEHLKVPTDEVCAWSGSGYVLVANLGGTEDIDSFVIARHTIPTGATITIEGGPDGASWPESASLTWREGVIAHILSTAWSVAYLRLTLASATGGTIGWWWAGEALSTEKSADRLLISRDYALSRSGGFNPSSLYAGAGRSGLVEWRDWLTQTDFDNLVTMIAAAKTNNDQPIVILPHTSHPEEAALVRIDTDAVQIEDRHQFQPNATAKRLLSVSMPFAPVYE